MKSSGNSSAATPSLHDPRPAGGYRLTGPSTPVDPRRQAVRPDLADVRLAEYVFAPHYAAPLPMTVAVAAPLRARPEEGAEVLGQLEPGDLFEALDFAHEHGWGVAPGAGLVGYVARAALATRR